MNLNLINRIETHCHSDYSNIRILDSINKLERMIPYFSDLGLKGMVLTDHECLCGSVKLLKLEKSLKENKKIAEDFKCGIGNEIYLTETRERVQKYYHFILIAKDTIGFRQLSELSSKSWYSSYESRGLTRVPTLKSELYNIVSANPGHLIATTACIGGELGSLILQAFDARKKDPQLYEKCLNDIDNFIGWCKNLFGDDFYIECGPSLGQDQIIVNKFLQKYVVEHNLKTIYGTDAHYLSKADRYAHKAYLNSKEGDREIDSFYEYAHAMDNNEAYEYLSRVFSLDEFTKMCDNSMEIYDKISKYEIFQAPIIPEIEVKPKTYSNKINDKYERINYLLSSSNEQERYWITDCLLELDNKYLVNSKYLDRLEEEADIIWTIGQKLNICLYKYFNTFQHYIDLFWDCGSIVGAGRGSSVSFLSNYLMGITQLDPLEWGLHEWRFLNRERIELPDIDLDLSPSKRPIIFKKMREERGEDRVIQVATFGTEASRSAILSAARGYRSEEYPDGIPVDVAQYISSLIPSERGFIWSIDEMLNGNEEKDRKPNKTFIDEMDKYPGFLDIVISIEGLVNKRSQHASGVILYNDDPYKNSAYMRSPSGDLTTQFELHDSEELGDTKFDVLLTEVCDRIVITVELLKKYGYFDKNMSLKEIYNKYLHPSKIDLKDQRIWDALSSGEITSIFQFNTDVGLTAAKSIKPQNPIEMMMANALIRLTGEKGQERPIDRYIRMKNNINEWYDECRTVGLTEEEVKVLEPYYLPVCGTPTTQEKLMVLCMDKDIAHFSLKEANAARKTCAKKKLSEIPALEEKFISQCPRELFGRYVWKTAIEPQMSYALNG